MNRTKLLQNPLPINRDAYRVVKKAEPEDSWQPIPKLPQHQAPPGSVIKTIPIPREVLCGSPWLADLIGKRRGRMVLLGLAEANGIRGRWVVRCDCGNHEYRSKPQRWLLTEADDMCNECRHRRYLIQGYTHPRAPAKRGTKPD